MKKVLFVTGTRADFGKLKPLIKACAISDEFSPQLFVTGMHMLERYGSTWEEVVSSAIAPVYPFVNQGPTDSMDVVLAKTIGGLSDYVKERRPDLLVVHGDRVEALAGAIVGTLSNVRVAHIEGGELSGTVDEILRHSISKLSHVHFVANTEAERRLIQLGENPDAIHVIGSPDIDVMESSLLPETAQAMDHYGLDLSNFAIMIFHPVTTDTNPLTEQTRTILDAMEHSGLDYVIIESNNDAGSDFIRGVYLEYEKVERFHFFPSMRFEYFLSFLKSARFIIGNSSAGVREAPHFGVPAINLGSRQLNRVKSRLVVDTPIVFDEINRAISRASQMDRKPEKNFGHGKSAEGFLDILLDPSTWNRSIQKQFVDVPTLNGGVTGDE